MPFPGDHDGDVFFLFGRDEKGRSVALYFWGKVHRMLYRVMPGAGGSADDLRGLFAGTKLGAETRLHEHTLQPIHGYSECADETIEIYTTTRRAQEDARRVILERRASRYRECEEHLTDAVAACNALGACPGAWCEVAGAVRVAASENHRTRCEVEYFLETDAFQGRATRITPEDAPPFPRLRVLSFDIETWSPNPDRVPLPEHADDRIYAIASVTHETGGGAEQPTETALQLLLPSAYAGGLTKAALLAENYTKVDFYFDEIALCNGFADFVAAADPDIVAGYNTDGYDIPWIFRRMGATAKHSRMFSWGRVIGQRVRPYETRAGGYQAPCPGRILLDAYPYFRGLVTLKLPRYTLDAVARAILGGGEAGAKVDLSYRDQHDFYASGEPAKLLRIAKYVYRDAELVMRLLERALVVPKTLALGRIMNTFAQEILSRGATMHNYNYLVSEARARGAYLNPLPPQGMGLADPAPHPAGEGTFTPRMQGGRVFKPLSGLYMDHVDASGAMQFVFLAVMDFASLYPSSIQALELDIMAVRLGSPELVALRQKYVAAGGPSPDNVTLEEHLACFQRPMPPGHEPVLPSMLRRGGEAREEYRRLGRDAKARGDAQTAAVMDAQQQAQKVANNSVYGVQNMQVYTEDGKPKSCVYPCALIAATTTAAGRFFLESAKRYATEPHATRMQTGHTYVFHDTAEGARVEPDTPTQTHVHVYNVYGDTDSIMPCYVTRVDLGEDGRADLARTEAARATRLINEDIVARFNAVPGIIDLEMETIIQAGHFINPKMYAFYGSAGGVGAPYKLKLKGLDRRDVSPVVMDTVREVIRTRLVDRDAATTLRVFTRIMDDMVEGRVPLDRYALSVEYAKEVYKTPETMAIVHLKRQLEARGQPLALHQRVEYIIGRPKSNGLVCEKVIPVAFATLQDVVRIPPCLLVVFCIWHSLIPCFFLQDVGAYITRMHQRVQVHFGNFKDYEMEDIKSLRDNALARWRRIVYPSPMTGWIVPETSKKRTADADPARAYGAAPSKRKRDAPRSAPLTGYFSVLPK